jgi:PAS domain S-box-containing protein
MDAKKAACQKIEILIVEDSLTQAEHLRFILEGAGFGVFSASNGKEALACLSEHRPDIVISDIVMPEMDGYELCRRIRAEASFAEMPVILVTALSDPHDVIKGLEAGANNFVTKPYNEEALLSRIEYLIANRNLRRESKPGTLDILFSGQNYHITADRLQILDLLLSTYENAHRQNDELRAVQKELTETNRRLEETVRAMERARAEAESERRRLEAVMEALPVGMAITDAQGARVKVNAAFERVWGGSASAAHSLDEQAAEHAWWADTGKRITPEEWASAVVLKEGAPVVGQLMEIERFDGSHGFVLNSAAPVKGPAGDIEGVAVAIEDITELRNAEKAVLRAKQEWERTFDAIPDLVAILDDHHRIVRVNRAMATRLSLTTDECVGKVCHSTVHGLDCPPGFCPHVLTLADGQEHLAEVHEDCLGGDFIVSTSPLTDEYERQIGSVHVARDITDRKHAEDALRRSVERLNILSETASHLLMSERPQEVVEALCRKVMEHLDCHAFFNYLVDQERDCLRLNAYAGITDETAREIHFLDYGAAVCGCAARDGCRIVAENIPATPDVRTDLVRSLGIKAYACHPLLVRGRAVGTLSFGTRSRLTFTKDELALMKTVADQVATAMERIDLLHRTEQRADELEERVQERTEELEVAYRKLVKETEEKEQVEQQLRQAQKLEALGVLTGGIAHDFNNILAAIIGFGELIRDHIPKDDRERRHIERVLQAGMRGRELVRQMLTFSRQTEQEKKPLRLSSIVKESVKLLRASIPATISINTTVISESGAIMGDPVQIQQVLMNLATNAAHAMMEKGGALDIDLTDFSLTRSNGDSRDIPAGSYMKLVVRDSGSGIAAEIKDRIFDPFFTTKKIGEGTGLGLSVVMGIVKQCQGYITVESELKKGSTFTIYFPKVEEEPKVEEGDYGDIPTGQESILFVDDEEALAEIGEDILAELGYKVTCRTNSREALALFSLDPTRFDLVITDMTMPELTGIDLAREMMRIRPDIPVILTTGFSHLINGESALAEGIRGYAMKPLTKKEIAKTVRNVLDEKM